MNNPKYKKEAEEITNKFYQSLQKQDFSYIKNITYKENIFEFSNHPYKFDKLESSLTYDFNESIEELKKNKSVLGEMKEYQINKISYTKSLNRPDNDFYVIDLYVTYEKAITYETLILIIDNKLEELKFCEYDIDSIKKGL